MGTGTEDTEFARASHTLPQAVRVNGALALKVIGGSNAMHDPREFMLPLDAEHLTVLRESLPRHVILMSVLAPLCREAGVRGDIDVNAAAHLLDATLLQQSDKVEALLTRVEWDRGLLVAHGADIELLNDHRVLDAMRSATPMPDWERAQEDDVEQRRARRGVTLIPLDAAVLRYTGQYVHGSTLPRRIPEAVPDALLPEVMQVIAAAEKATAPLRIARDARRGATGTDPDDWRRMEAAVATALQGSYDGIADDAVKSVAFLMCTEAAGRARLDPFDTDAERTAAGSASRASTADRVLLFTDLQEDTETWEASRSGEGSRSSVVARSAEATEAFWNFVAERYGSRNDLFILEEESAGDGIQLIFEMDAIARLRMLSPATSTDEADYHVEYGLISGLDHYRSMVRGYIADGFSGLDTLTKWTADVEEFETWREVRRSAGPETPER